MKTQINPNESLLFNTTIFKQLTNILDANKSWRILAENSKQFDQSQITALSLSDTPTADLLCELDTKLYKIKHLRFILQECQLYEALSVISDPEPLRIVKQPTEILNGSETLKLKIGKPFKLEFDVRALPPPTFVWFRDNEIIQDQNSSVLTYENFQICMEGNYTCYASHIVDDKKEEIFSDTVNVQALPEAPQILDRPDLYISLREGSPILLRVKASGYPSPQFQWVYENRILEGQNRDVLCIPKSDIEKHSGAYKCYISNKANEVIVITNVMVYKENVFPIFTESVTKKIALLIANDNYQHLDPLHTPVNDVRELAVILKTFGFKTLCFRNLNLYEMKIVINIFTKMITKGAYAVFYYAGHGFEYCDRYMLPTDCPEVTKYMKKDAVSESQVLSLALAKQPVMLLVLLDMCLKLPDKDTNGGIYNEVPDTFQYEAHWNLIRGYSTTSHKAAYEIKNEYNGVYVGILKRFLPQNIPILTVLQKVNKEMEKLCLAQLPTITIHIAQDFLLNNKIEGLDNRDPLYEMIDLQPSFVNETVVLRKYLDVFNNYIQVDVHNLHYKPEDLPKKNIDKSIDIIKDVQRLRSDLNITLNSGDILNIRLPSYFKLSSLFRNI